MADAEDISVSKNNKSDTFHSMIVDGFSNIPNKKISLYMFFIVILLLSDVFIERVLGKIDGATATYAIGPSTYGSVIIALLIVIGFIALSILNRNEII